MKYEIIYADPPWSFKLWGKPTLDKRSAESHYATMRLADICALPVETVAARDCALFLWVTMPTLPDALQVLSAWGFSYRTCAFVWVKRTRKSGAYHFGMGYWTRANAELCLLAVRGTPRRISAGVPQIVDAPLSRHSVKPAEVRNRIVALLGDRSRIELFAREHSPGWDALGLEIDGMRLEESLPLHARARPALKPLPNSSPKNTPVSKKEAHG